MEKVIPIIDINKLDKDQVCADIDEDCPGIKDKVACWIYDPEQGLCPWLY